eukprot:m.19814 g.19814  ORF g.19814 m.19814 type:complete len:1099 (-) comp8753_c0_seq1:158-3454(-)
MAGSPHLQASHRFTVSVVIISIIWSICCISSACARRPVTYQCGSSRKYWSTSCGAIGTAAARHCSEGGTLVNPSSCKTHFEYGSRACGFLLMGCSSMCKIEEVECQPGRVTFVSRQTELTFNTTSKGVEVLVARQYGYETPIHVDVHIVKTGKGYGKALGHRLQSLTWGHLDAAPKSVFVSLHAISTHCSCQTECAVDLYLVNAQNCRVGAYPTTQLIVRPFAPSHFSTIYLPRTQYSVVETQEFVDVQVSRTNHSTSPPSRVDISFVSSSGSPFIDFHFQDARTLTWKPDGNATLNFRVHVRPNHEHAPNDTIYLTFSFPRDMQLPGYMPVVELVIFNADDPESEAERNLTQSPAYREKIMPWISEIQDIHAANRFAEAWNAFPVKAGEVVIPEGRVPRFLAIVAEGEFELTAKIGAIPRKRKATQGQLVSFFSALQRTKTAMRVEALTEGLLFVLDAHLFHLHNKSAHQDLYKVLKHEFLRQLIVVDGKRIPVVMFPGFMSSQLEAWRRKQCNGVDIEIMDQVWISLEQMMQTITIDRYCWLDCLALGANQSDVPCKVRAGTGIAAIRELNSNIRGITTIFRSLIAFLAEKWGYDPQSLVAMPYDWRLSPDMLQRRDKFFTLVKAKIETAVSLNEGPAVLVAHSLGNNIIWEFFDWLQQNYPSSHLEWTEQHVIAYYGLGAPFVGATSAAYASLIGDNMGLPLTSYQARTFGSTLGSTPLMLPRPAAYPTSKEYTCPHPYCGMGQETLRLREMGALDDLKVVRHSVNAYEMMCDTAALPGPFDELEQHEANLSSFASLFGSAVFPQYMTIKDGWVSPILNVTLRNGTILNFDAVDFESGKVYEDIGHIGNDSHALRVADMIRSHYHNPEVRSALERLPTRPPIKHVALIYGVNVKTMASIHLAQTEDSDELTVSNTSFEYPKGSLGSTLNGLRCSGDGTVPYVSLSWAHAWHLSSAVSVTRKKETIQPYFKHVLGDLTPTRLTRVIDTVWPEHTIFDSYKGGYRTTVYEVDGLDHREAVKAPFAIEIIDELMQDLIQLMLHEAFSDVELLDKNRKKSESDQGASLPDRLKSLLADLKKYPQDSERLKDIISLLEDI